MSDEIGDRGRHLFGGPSYADMGVVTAIDDHPAWGKALTVELVPGDLNGERGGITARPIWAGTGRSRGLFYPVSVGDEVLVVMPAGDPNRAVALLGLCSSARPMPSWDNLRAMLTHPGGLEVRLEERDIPQQVVLEALLADLAAAMNEIKTLLGDGNLTWPGGVSTPTPIPLLHVESLVANLLDGQHYRSTALKTS